MAYEVDRVVVVVSPGGGMADLRRSMSSTGEAGAVERIASGSKAGCVCVFSPKPTGRGGSITVGLVMPKDGRFTAADRMSSVGAWRRTVVGGYVRVIMCSDGESDGQASKVARPSRVGAGTRAIWPDDERESMCGGADGSGRGKSIRSGSRASAGGGDQGSRHWTPTQATRAVNGLLYTAKVGSGQRVAMRSKSNGSSTHCMQSLS